MTPKSPLQLSDTPRLGVTPEDEVSARLKFEILATGLRIDGAADAALFGTSAARSAKRPLQTRSGISGGLDLMLPGGVFVNAPVVEAFAAESALSLSTEGNELVIHRDGADICTVTAIPEPEYYGRRTNDGSRGLREIGQMCSPDRFCYGMTGPGCSFWRIEHRCRYCSIGSEVNEDALRKREDQLYEALEAACQEAEWPARHVLLGGGTPSGDDMGAKLASRLCEGVKARFGLPVYVMIVAPLKDEYIDMLAAAGVDELGMNLEFWSAEAWAEFIPGKEERVGKGRYLAALEHAVNVIGPVRTRSILIAGLEPAEETLAAATTLAHMGVMPIISPFRPLRGSALMERRGFTPEVYVDLYSRSVAAVGSAGGFLGPNCVCCQNNTLTLPFGPNYHRY